MRMVCMGCLVKMIIQDVRGEGTRKESNGLTHILDDVIEDTKKDGILSKITGFGKSLYSLAEYGLAGYLTGYVIGGDQSIATQTAEYAMVYYLGLKFCVLMPLMNLIKSKSEDAKEKVKDEKQSAAYYEKIGQFHEYEPKEGIDFKNHAKNYANYYKNVAESLYCDCIEITKKPISKTIRKVVVGTAFCWASSLLLDAGNNIVDLVAINPIEKTLELSHYILQQIEPIQEYLSYSMHEHVGDFNQREMMFVGTTVGMLGCAKSFIKGSYYRIRARVFGE